MNEKLNAASRSFNTEEEAKEALRPAFGKYDVELIEIAGKRVVAIGTDCVYDGIWDKLYHALLWTFPVVTPNKDVAVDETSRLRDEFIESLKKVCGIDDVITVFDGF